VAYWLQTHGDPDRAQEYLDTGLKAFAWAESRLGPNAEDDTSIPHWRRRNPRDVRCLAAAELYRATGDEKWNEMYLQRTRFKDPDALFLLGRLGHNTDPQGVAAWTYLRTDLPGVDKEVQRNIQAALIRDAERDLRWTEETEFHWSGGLQRSILWGALSMPESHNLVRAHFITGDERYLRGIVKSTLSGAGANPLNMAYVTRIGSRWPQHPLHVDSLVTNQPLYEGVTIGGPNWSRTRVAENEPHQVETLLHPPVEDWPATEAYYDVVIWGQMNEFTVHQTMAHTSFVWGYLAARDPAGRETHQGDFQRKEE
jgi:endoglucanase